MKKGIVIGIIIGGIIFGSIGVYATVQILSKDISYTKKDGTITNVEDAINELYENKNDLIIKIGTNNKNNGVETYVVQRDCDNAIIISGQASFQYSINSDNNYQSLTQLGEVSNGRGFYYKDNISFKKGDIVYYRRDSSSIFGYAIIY